jgi:UDP-N-acetylglucosamine transferase subunit ALG13
MALRVFVTVGTHEQPFARLLVAAKVGAQTLEGSEWVVQYGVGAFDSDRMIRAEPYFAHEEIQAWNGWADIVLSHASPGAVFDALGGGAQPIVLPRARVHGEHVNNHQVRFAVQLKALGLAQVAHSEADVTALLRATALEGRVERRSRLAAINAASHDRTSAFVVGFGQVIEGLRPAGAAIGKDQVF